ncbi:hypothetical protein BH23CHL5_BH23CHL5_02520 [soil metagenome]
MSISDPISLARSVGRNVVSVVLTRYAVPITLCLIIILGGVFRLSGRNWDEGQNLHPDERFLTMVATTVTWPGSIGEYFDSSASSLNPYNNNYPTFIYGTLPLALSKIWGELTGNTVYGNYHIASRSMSAFADLLVVFLVFLVGRRLFGDTTGLLAALLYSLTVLSIQLSHFGTFESFVTLFCLATFYFALRANDRGRWWEFGLAGVMAGLAVASKLSAAPIVAVVALPLIEQIRIHGFDGITRRASWKGLPAVLGVVLAAVCAVWIFRVTQPYAFASGNPLNFRFDQRWLNDVAYWRSIQSGEGDAPPSVQWANREPLIFVLRNLVVWGLGPALGIAAIAGLVFSGIRLLTAKRMPPTWAIVLAGWPAFHIVYYGLALTKTMRYLAPAYPFLVLLAAAFLVYLASVLRPRAVRAPWLAYLPMALVVGFTAFYALAFSSIYTRPVTRISASEWIFANIPPGSGVLTEHWDDGLPLSLAGFPSPSEYPGTQLPLYDLDSAEKLSAIVSALDSADYLFLTSNRLYDSIPRIPERYPMTIEYYRMLFAEELGFELVETFTSYPSFLGFELNDGNAEEAFSVYDHPKVLIFQKTDAFDRNQLSTHLARFLDEDIVQVRSAMAGHNMLMMSDADRQTQQSGGTWHRIFNPESLSNRFPTLSWYLALQVMAIVAIPVCWRVFHRLPDHGYALAKTLGLLGTGTVAWLLASLHLVAFGQLAVVLGLLAVAAGSVITSGGAWQALFDDLKRAWRTIAVVEVLFLLTFLAFVFIRTQNPDIWHPARGGEKPMEFAYFNAILRSTHFPPYDPWFAGGYINYYYFGYVLLASITRLTRIVPEMAFNLAVATCFALTVVNAWTFVVTILKLIPGAIRTSSRWTILALGLLGPLFVTIIGNLDMARRFGAGEWGFTPVDRTRIFSLGTFGDIVRGVFRAVFDPRSLPTDAFWAPSRIIGGTINEFPYFSFLFGDLHPHMIAIPFTTAALIVAVGVLAARSWPDQYPFPVEGDEPLYGIKGGWQTWLRDLPWASIMQRTGLIVVAALITGALYPLNTWDYPTYLLIVGGSLFLLDALGSATAAKATGLLDWRISFAIARCSALSTGAVILLGRLIFWPYFSNYQPQHTGFEPWMERSTPSQYMIIHGLWLFIIGSFVIADLFVAHRREPSSVQISPSGHRVAFTWPAQSILAALLLALGGLSVWMERLDGLLLSSLSLVVLAAWQRKREPLMLFLYGIVALGLAISLGVEHYVLRGDIGRMNTVFKFYLQVWILFALASAVLLVLFVIHLRSLTGWITRAPWIILLMVLVVAGLIYPAYATPARIDDRFTSLPSTLDGMEFMEHATFVDAADGMPPTEMQLSQDRKAIEWLRTYVSGSPVILEAVTPLYRWGSRVSVYTGLPTVIGWDWHQTQQRPGFQTLIDQRKAAVQQMYGEVRSFESIRPLLDRYHVQYIYVGPVERAYYNEQALAKFDEAVTSGHLDLVYDQDGVRIFRYDPAGNEF